MNESDILERASEALRSTAVPPGPPAALVAATLAGVDNRLAAMPSKPVLRPGRNRRYIGLGFATAFAILVAAGGLLWFGGGSASAEARVRTAMDNATKARSVRLVVSRDNDGKLEPLITITFLGDQGRWEDRRNGKDVVTVFDTSARKELTMDLREKSVQQSVMDKESIGLMARQQKAFFDPLAVARGTKEMTVKELDGEKLDGRPMKVFMLTHPGNQEHAAMTGIIWVDEKTELPARIKLLESEGKPDTVFTFSDWNKDFDLKLFNMDVPEGFKLLTEPAAATPELPIAVLQRAAEKAAKAKSFRYVAIYIPLDDTTSLPARVTNYHQGTSQRLEALDQSTIEVRDHAAKRVLELDVSAKVARFESLTDAEVADAKRWAADLPRLVVDQFKGDSDYELKERPQEVVNGRPARVLEAHRKAGAKPSKKDGVVEQSVVWIDAETGFPARMRVRTQEVTGKREAIGLFDQWNEDMDPKLFKLDVPPGYKLEKPTEKK